MDKIETHETDALNRMTERLKGKPIATAFFRALARQIQDLEDAAWDVFIGRWIDSAVGVQLDAVGKYLNLARGSLDDDTYRLWLKARVKVNRSRGTPEDLIAIFHLLSEDSVITYTPMYPAGFQLDLGDAVFDSSLHDALLSFIRAATDGGVRGMLTWSEHDEDETFSFLGAPGLGFPDPAHPTTTGGYFSNGSD